MSNPRKIFIDGAWTTGSGSATRELIDPATGIVNAVVVEGNAADVDTAVAAARRAFDEGPWRDTPALARARILL